LSAPWGKGYYINFASEKLREPTGGYKWVLLTETPRYIRLYIYI